MHQKSQNYVMPVYRLIDVSKAPARCKSISVYLEAWRRLWGRCAGGEHGRKVPAPTARPLLPAAADSAAAASGDACCFFSALPGLMAAAAIAARCSSSSHLQVRLGISTTVLVLGVSGMTCTADMLRTARRRASQCIELRCCAAYSTQEHCQSSVRSRTSSWSERRQWCQQR